MSELASLFSLEVFRNAFAMSLILSLLFGILSFFIVMRKMAFMGAGIAHTAFGGVALGVLMEIDPMITSVIFCTGAALIIGNMARSGRISYDTGIGIFFSFSMALGALFIALKEEYTFDLTGYLFGNILGITQTEIYIALTILVLFLLFIALFFPKLLFLTFDPEVSRASGVATVWLDNMLLLFLALIIVVSIKSVGIILVSALVVLPASFGMLVSGNYRFVFLLGIIYAVFIMLSGLYLSNLLNSPTGATIVTAGTLLYFGAMAISRRR